MEYQAFLDDIDGSPAPESFGIAEAVDSIDNEEVVKLSNSLSLLALNTYEIL